MEVKGELTTRLTIGFRVHPNYGNDIREQYRNQLAELANSTILSDIISQLRGEPIHIPMKDDGLPQLIMNSEYTLS